MFIKLLGSFPKLNEDKTLKLSNTGKRITVFKYSVHGTKEELAQYEKIQGEHFRKTDEGIPLFFTTKPAGLTVQLGISQNDKLYMNTTNIDLATSMVEQFGEIGKMMAMPLLGIITPTHRGDTKEMIENTEPLD